MNFSQEIIVRIELLVSNIGIIMGSFLGVFLLTKKDESTKYNIFLSLYLIVFSLRMTKSLFYHFFSFNATVHYIFLGSLLTIGPSLWFYTLHLQKRVIKKIHYLLHYTPFLVVISCSWLIPYHGKSFLYLGLFLHGLMYCFVLVFRLLTSKKEHLKTRQWLLLLSAITVIMFLNSIFIFFEIVPFYPTSSFVFSLSIMILSIYALNNLWIFKPAKTKYATSNLNTEEIDKYHEKLKRIIEKDKIYLDPELTLSKLSALVGISSKQLSQIINQSQKVNYSQYIAQYRIEEAKRLLKNPEYSHYKISAIAYESGFSSISSFNSAFKKITNTTAIQFRDSIV